MKIEWLNAECTEAIVTRGWWRWKQQAHVHLPDPNYDILWDYVATGRRFDHCHLMQDARRQALVEIREWVPVRRARLPEASLIDRTKP